MVWYGKVTRKDSGYIYPRGIGIRIRIGMDVLCIAVAQGYTFRWTADIWRSVVFIDLE